MVPCPFSDLVVTLRGRRKGMLVCWWSETCRGRCRRSEPWYIGAHSPWQGAALWTWWSLACFDFVVTYNITYSLAGSFSELEVLFWHPRLDVGVASFAECAGRASRCESRCANVEAVAALGAPPSADFVTRPALWEPQSQCRSRGRRSSL